MFTGLVETTGAVAALESHPSGDLSVVVDCQSLPRPRTEVGDSISVNGVCLTVAERTETQCRFDVSAETLSLTTVDRWQMGERVNLERALTPESAIGGHLVSGHVDGLGEVTQLREDARSVRVRIRAPSPLMPYLATKGSICVDGVSLTVNSVGEDHFDVNIVPHTFAVTTFSHYAPGARVNLEVDLIARYVERLLGSGTRSAG